MAMKTGLAKLEETESSWETHAKGDKFYDMSLDEYKARVQLSRDARALIASLEQQLVAARSQKKDIDEENLTLEKNVAKGIAGDAKHGEDSALFEGTGRVRKSERKTGLTRKRKNPVANK